MRTTLLMALLFVGCGVSEAELNDQGEELSEDQGELGTSTRSYVVLRRDFRRCAAPLCGGWWAHDVNRSTLTERYVSALDFSKSNLNGLPEHQDDVTGAASFEVVLYGKLGPAESRFNTRQFIVTSAWRGMPGVTFSEPTDSFFRLQNADIQCFAAPCASLRATRLHSTAKFLHHDLDVTRASVPLLDQDWLSNRAINDDALVAGRFVDGAVVGVGQEKILEASQVFVHLPDMTQSCPRYALAQCPEGQTNVFTRNVNRCLVPAGCGVAGVCRFATPTCTEGYSLVSWPGGAYSCTRHACDPTFIVE